MSGIVTSGEQKGLRGSSSNCKRGGYVRQEPRGQYTSSHDRCMDSACPGSSPSSGGG